MTNEILSIVLYFVSGVVVASIAMAIYGMRNKINGLERQTREIDNTILSITKSIENLHRGNESIYREFELVHRKSETKSDEIYQTIHQQHTEIYRYVDSRYDKLENKLIDIVKNGCEPVKSK